MSHSYIDLDVRPILNAGGEPFGKIMETVGALGPGQGLRLLAPFKPVPLFQVLGQRGFDHQARELGGGDWEVLFSRAEGESGTEAAPAPPPAPEPAAGDAGWREPLVHMDNRDLEPPEPMVRILAALEEMQPGETLAALLCREPMFLLPELAKRGHEWRGGFDPDGTTYRIHIRVGGGTDAAA